MSILGVGSFRGGETTRQRVSEAEAAILARCSGYDPRGGFLSPEKLVTRVSSAETVLPGTTPDQVPFAFLDKDGVTRIIARDSTEAFRECVSGAWGSAGSVADILVESVPVRMGEQIIFPTGGPDPKLMAYEPGSPSTKLRPLSLKAPTDYAANQPTVTPSLAANYTAATIAFVNSNPDTITDSANGFVTAGFAKGQTITVSGSASNNGTYLVTTVAAGTLTLASKETLVVEGAGASVTIKAPVAITLFDSEAATAEPSANETAWTLTADGTTAGCTIDDTGTNVTILKIANAAANLLQNKQLFRKGLGDTGLSLSGKCFLVIDLMVANDPQAYSVDGLFVNDAGMQSSGYILGLYSDKTCTALIASFHVPRLLPQGKVNRIAFNMGTRTETCKGVAVLTETFFTPPTSGVTFELSCYCEDFTDDWGHKGNFLLPAVQWDKSPWSPKLTQLLSAGQTQMVDLPVGANLVTNPGFETGAFGSNVDLGDWQLAGYATKRAESEGWPARSGGACVELDNYGAEHDSIYRKSGFYIPIDAGREYKAGCYYLSPSATQSEWRITIQPKDGIAGANVGSAFAFPSGSTWYTEDKSDEYRLKMETFTCPAGATHCNMTIQIKSTGSVYYADFRIDDVFLYATNQAMQGSAVILQKFSPANMADREPGNPKVRYAYCFGGKDLLGVSADLWKLMVSNPSQWATDDSAPFADPWRTYAVAITLPSGPLTAAAVNAGGTGYEVDDILTVDQGNGGKVKVATLGAGGGGTAVATVTILLAGTGYTDGDTAVDTDNETDAGGAGCTLDLTAADATDEYGDYLLWFLIYRQLYEPETQTWYADVEGKRYLSEWGFVNYVAIGATASYTDSGVDAITSISDVPVPKFMELTNSYAASARHVMYSEGRVYALGANYDNETGRWESPTAIQTSNYGKPWAFQAVPSSKNDGSEGEWLDGYAVTGAEGRGIVHWRGEKYVFLDSEFFLLRGDNSMQGWRFIWVDSVGLKSARSLAGGRRALIWHDGHHFQASLGGAASSISRFLVDSTLIDWAEPHGAVHFDEQYVFLCALSTGDYARMVYDLARLPEPGWRTRYSDALNVVGICTDGQDIYGVTPGGDAVNIFGSLTTDYGASSVLREVWTQFLKASGPSADAHVGRALFDIVTDQVVAIDMDLTLNWQGAKDGTQDIDLDPDASTTRYDVEANGNGDAFQIKLSYTGTSAPDIYSMAVERDDVAAVL